MRGSTALVASSLLLFASRARAYPGPDSVAVLASADSAESSALADSYAAARAVPTRQVCKLVGIPTTDDVSLADYQSKILAPLEACLKSGAVHDRIEAVVIMRGVPLRVAVPIASGSATVSLAAALSIWESTTTSGDGGAVALLGEDPGQMVNCGTPCEAAKWRNPLQTLSGPFSATYTSTATNTSTAGTVGVTWKPLLVTMLTGRSQADAQMLLDSAMAAEASGGARGSFVFMHGADPARSIQDSDFPWIVDHLKALGFTDASEVPFNANLTGQTLASFFVGTASIGQTIEGNTYLPGSLVDNLTSFGAVPENFAASGESQVSIARWVEKGVGGVHGTVDEPLSSAFPRRTLILDYVNGASLAESYFRAFPYLYWKNLVLGDPMLAPYAKRPAVTITGITDGASQTDATTITATATDTSGGGIANVTLYVDGVSVATAPGASVSACVKLPASNAQILAVAQTKTQAKGALAKFPPKGWSEIHATGSSAGDASCTTADGGMADGGAPDASSTTDGGVADGGAPDASGATAEGGVDDGGALGASNVEGGCSCRSSGPGASSSSSSFSFAGFVLLAGALFARARRSRQC